MNLSPNRTVLPRAAMVHCTDPSLAGGSGRKRATRCLTACTVGCGFTQACSWVGCLVHRRAVRAHRAGSLETRWSTDGVHLWQVTLQRLNRADPTNQSLVQSALTGEMFLRVPTAGNKKTRGLPGPRTAAIRRRCCRSLSPPSHQPSAPPAPAQALRDPCR